MEILYYIFKFQSPKLKFITILEKKQNKRKHSKFKMFINTSKLKIISHLEKNPIHCKFRFFFFCCWYFFGFLNYKKKLEKWILVCTKYIHFAFRNYPWCYRSDQIFYPKSYTHTTKKKNTFVVNQYHLRWSKINYFSKFVLKSIGLHMFFN